MLWHIFLFVVAVVCGVKFNSVIFKYPAVQLSYSVAKIGLKYAPQLLGMGKLMLTSDNSGINLEGNTAKIHVYNGKKGKHDTFIVPYYKNLVVKSRMFKFVVMKNGKDCIVLSSPPGFPIFIRASDYGGDNIQLRNLSCTKTKDYGNEVPNVLDMLTI